MKTITAIIILFFTVNIFFSRSVFSYSAKLESNTEKAANEVSNFVNKIMQDMFKSFGGSKNVNINTNKIISPPKEVSFDNLFNSESFSSGDIMEAIRAALIFAINLFLIVINIVVEVFRGLLGVLNDGK